MARRSDGEADVIQLCGPQRAPDVVAGCSVDGVRGKLSKTTRCRLLTGIVVDGCAGNVVRVWSADGVLCLKVLVRPVLCDVGAFFQVFVWAVVAGLGEGLRLDESAFQHEVYRIPASFRRPAGIAGDLTG